MSDLRPIEAINPGTAAAPDNLGPVPMLQWLKISLLRVDPSYQRDIAYVGQRNIRKILASFCWAKFSPVIVSPVAGGLYAIIDGQHRTTAALMAGMDEVPCQVVIADQRMQAECFGAVNSTTTKLTGYASYRAALAAGDALALRTDAVCKQAGVEMIGNMAGNRMKPRETCALAVIERISGRNEKLAVLTLKCVLASAKDRPGHLSAHSISAVFAVLNDWKEWAEHPRVIEAFSKIDLDRQYWAGLSKRAPGLSGGHILRTAIMKHLTEELSGGVAPAGSLPRAVPPRDTAFAAALTKAIVAAPTKKVTHVFAPPQTGPVSMGDPPPGRSALDQRRANGGTS
jgi:hypothetical protein